MDELQRKLDQRYENTNPRKVRFKLASSYSGRVLKHVYEDGQELDSPAEKYPHSFVHRKIPPSHLEMDQYCGFQDGSRGDQGAYPPPGLIAHRINVYRGVGSYKAAVGQSEADEGDAKNTVLDFGKIIIYTSNLRIIRAPPRKPETEQHHGAHAEEPDIPPMDRPTKERPARERPTRERSTKDASPKDRPTKDASPKDRPTKDVSPKDRPPKDASLKDRPPKDASLKDRPPKDRPTKDKPPKAKERGTRRRRAASTQPSEERGERQRKHAEDKEPGSCQQCGGSGCAPCSLCHGSKLSMLANRFNESISDLRCQACYPHGLERCPSCTAK